MNVDPLIGSFLRHINRQVLNLTESPTGTRLPDPHADRNYLLYLHIPYCVVLCPFCSFHRVEFKREKTEGYFAGLRREIAHVSERGYRFDELYVGGGTPTVMPGELIATLELLRRLHDLGDISVETNPDDIEADLPKRLRDAGVTRLSVGVQSFDDGLLRQMQRYEKYGSGSEIRGRLKRAQGVFDTLNADLIFNFPKQTEAMLDRDIDILVDEIGIDQVSFYPLMMVDSSRKKMRETTGLADYSRERGLYERIAQRMLDAGYSRNSSWCFSRTPGQYDEYIVDREEYVGLGSGAFSYLAGTLYASSFSINHYLQLVESGKTGTICHRRMGAHDQMRYWLMMRLFSGSLDIAAAEERFEGRFRRGLFAELAGLKAIGAVRERDDRLALTERGHYLWVMIMREFFTGVNTLREQMRHRISAERSILAGAGTA